MIQVEKGDNPDLEQTTTRKERLFLTHETNKELETSLKTLKEELLEEINPALIVPFTERIGLSWSGINYSVVIKEGKLFHRKKVTKSILRNISGRVEPGTLVGIIGPSGAGKTSLLNVLCRREKKGVSGLVLVNGQQISTRTFLAISGYVSQEDVLMGSLTPLELLRFVATLRLPSTMSHEEKEMRVRSLLKEMGIWEVRHRFIGFTGRFARTSGIKREILFLDEPTSGLDAYAARAIMIMLRKLAFMGHTIVATIHQPSAKIFQLLDQLIVIAEGQIIFAGPPHQVIDYFQELGYPCPHNRNPADHFMQLCYVPKEIERTSQVEGDEEAQDVHRLTLRSSTPEQVQQLITSWSERINSREVQQNEILRVFEGVKPVTEVKRVKKWIGTLFLRLGHNQLGVRNRLAAIFITLTVSAFNGLNASLYIFPVERGVFMKEKATQMYSTIAYLLAKFIADLPINTLLSIISGTLVYWLAGLNNSVVRWLIFILIIFLTMNNAFTLGWALSAAIRDTNIVVKIQPIIMLPFIIFGGFFINSNNVPVYFIWWQYISFIKYSFSAAAQIVLLGQTFTCNPNEVIRQSGGGEVCPITSGEQALEQFALEETSVLDNIIVLFGMWVGYLLLAWVALLFVKK